MHYYFLYGKTFRSAISFYNLEEIDETENYEVNVRIGKPDSDITEMMQSGITSSINNRRVWFCNYAGIFVIKDGNEIIIQPENESITEEKLASFVLGWAVAFLFHQCGMLAIHSTAIKVGENAILISGASGAGKSTTALELINRGYPYLADDIAMVSIGEKCTAFSGFPLQKVCRNVANELNQENLKYIDERKDKFAYFNIDNFCEKSLPIKALFFIEMYDGDKLIFEEAESLKKWTTIANSLFLVDAYRSLELPQTEMQKCLELACKINIFKIKRPKNQNTLNEICDFIISNSH